MINYHLIGVTGIVDSSERENYRYRVRIKRQLHAKCACAQKYHMRNNLLQKNFVHLIFVGGVTHKNFLAMKFPNLR